MTAPMRAIGQRVIGTVEEVSTERISVLLDSDAPQATALNTGTPAGFPRINGYVLIPVFERIAREGRKFGLGLVLASQRPSEVSQTVLSQCNTFLLHRLVNDRDQDLVKRLVPDGLGPLLRELPSLPTRRAILLGWAAPAPILVEVQDIAEDRRPHSPDPSFWEVWTGEQERSIDWRETARTWQGAGPVESTE